MMNVIKSLYGKLSIGLLIILLAAFFPIMEVRADDNSDSYDLIFDANYYYTNNKEEIKVNELTEQTLLDHFKRVGMRKGYQACPSFNVQSYKERYPDLEAVFGNDYTKYYKHYMNCGAAEGRDGSFDKNLYDLEMAKHINIPVEVSEADIRAYYDKAVFVGDSVMAGYRMFSTNPASVVNKAEFLARSSTAARHAIVDVSQDPYQPLYKGKAINIWNAIPLMDVDKVFIMYGTNDLGVYNPEITYGNYLELIRKIRSKSPDVEIHIISMTPVCAGREGRGLNNANVNIFNQLIIDGAEANNYSYVPLNPNLIDGNGKLIATYSSDKFVHLTSAAYNERWEPVFREYAKQQLSGSYELPATYSESIFK